MHSGPAVPGTEALVGLPGPRSAPGPRGAAGPAGKEAPGAPGSGRVGQGNPRGARQGSTAGDAGEASTSPLEKRQVPSRPGLFPPLRRPFWAARAAPPSLLAPAAPSRTGPVGRALTGWKFPSSAAPPPQKSPGRAVYARRRRRRRSLAAPAAPPP